MVHDPKPKMFPKITMEEHAMISASDVCEERNFGVSVSKYGTGILNINKTTRNKDFIFYQSEFKPDRLNKTPFHKSITGYFDSASDAVQASRLRWGMTLSIDKAEPS